MLIIAGIGNGEYCAITSNTTTELICAGGWKTNYYKLTIVSLDASSKFVVEPNWTSHPTTSGTVAFAPFEFNVTEGNVGGVFLMVSCTT